MLNRVIDLVDGQSLAGGRCVVRIFVQRLATATETQS